jgi:hypothetical protein
MAHIDPVLTYGIWIPGKGWLRGAGDRVFSVASPEIASGIAKRLGAKFEYIDQALIDTEATFLEYERRPWWRKVMDKCHI